jgi:hypothetical protein
MNINMEEFVIKVVYQIHHLINFQQKIILEIKSVQAIVITINQILQMIKSVFLAA